MIQQSSRRCSQVLLQPTSLPVRMTSTGQHFVQAQQWYNVPGEETTTASPVATKMGPILAKKGIPGYDQLIAPPRLSSSNKNASFDPNLTNLKDHSPRPKSRTTSAPSSGKPIHSTYASRGTRPRLQQNPPATNFPLVPPAAPNPQTTKSFLGTKMMRKLKPTMMMKTRRTPPHVRALLLCPR